MFWHGNGPLDDNNDDTRRRISSLFGGCREEKSQETKRYFNEDSGTSASLLYSTSCTTCNTLHLPRRGESTLNNRFGGRKLILFRCASE